VEPTKTSEQPRKQRHRRRGERERSDGGTRFVNETERAFARLLDFYRLAWEYEPRSFDLAWDDAGRPTEQFTPDFYLPELDLYVEVTRIKASLATRKNRKVRLLKELYPDVQVKLLNDRDFRALFAKYDLGEAG
jgi:hypoxanthine phosphoribosyltransferase